jgi:hypothetical protein
MSDPDPVADAFDKIGHPARLSILEALLEVRRTDDDPHVSFTELRDRSAVDDTGRFNYHLGELVGTFVHKGEAGYRLTSLGHRLLAPMVAGIYDPDRELDPIESPGACYDCGGSLRIEPAGAKLQVVCEDGHVVNAGLVGYPGVVADRPADEAVAALSVLNTQGVERAVAGVCPICHGPVDGAIGHDEGFDVYGFEAPCGTCGNQFATTVGSVIATHPEVVSFLADHGVDVRRAVPWSLPFRQAGAETVVSEEPLRLRVDVAGDETRLAVLVDGDGEVVSTERSGAP